MRLDRKMDVIKAAVASDYTDRIFHGTNYRKHWNRGTPERSGTFYGAHRKISRDVTVKISGFKRLVHNYLIAFIDALFNCLSILL